METVIAGQAKHSAQTSSDVLKCAEDAQVQASANLLAHLRKMINEPTFSDVVFMCRDGKRVHALRKLLAGRSEVLKCMLVNGMAESALYEIKLPEMSSLVLLSVFEFLYTGTLVEHLPQNLKVACELVIASRFFLLPELEMIARKHLQHTHLTPAVVKDEDLQRAASMLTEAISCKALCDEADVNLRELVTALSSNWSESLYIQSLSEDALHYLLANSKSNFEDDGKYLSFREYLRFRQVIRWWIFHGDLGSISTEVIDFIVPDERRAHRLCRSPDVVDRVDCTAQDTPRLSGDRTSLNKLGKASHLSSYFELNEAARNSAIRLASSIDCRQIHPLLLAKVVEPLGIVSAAEIQKSLRFHALRRSIVFKRQECIWYHGESYCTREQGYVIQKVGEKNGFAVMATAMSSSSTGSYQWRFILEDGFSDSVELGLTFFPSTAEAEKSNYDGKKLSDLTHTLVLRLEKSRVMLRRTAPGGHTEWVTSRTITLATPTTAVLNYCPSLNIVRLCINDIDCGIVWNHVPKIDFHPAASLGEKFRGCVRIELERGFDFL